MLWVERVKSLAKIEPGVAGPPECKATADHPPLREG